jgi:hypothetical protein
MISIKHINNEKVKAIPLPILKRESIKGFRLFAEPYAYIFLCAKKKSGKTSAIFKILKSCSSKTTKLFIFSSTVFKDDTWKYIIKYFKNRGNPIQTFTSIKEDKLNHLQKIIEELQVEDSESDSENDIEKAPKLNFLLFDTYDEEKIKKQKKNKKVAPENIFIFDDIGNELHNPFVNQLLKTNRHFLSKVIISSQYVNDMIPASRKQIDYWLLFKGHKDDKLKIIYDDADLSITFDEFMNLYKHATEEKYNFLLVDTRNDEFRKNFSHRYFLS